VVRCCSGLVTHWHTWARREDPADAKRHSSSLIFTISCKSAGQETHNSRILGASEMFLQEKLVAKRGGSGWWRKALGES